MKSNLMLANYATSLISHGDEVTIPIVILILNWLLEQFSDKQNIKFYNVFSPAKLMMTLCSTLPNTYVHKWVNLKRGKNKEIPMELI